MILPFFLSFFFLKNLFHSLLLKNIWAYLILWIKKNLFEPFSFGPPKAWRFSPQWQWAWAGANYWTNINAIELTSAGWLIKRYKCCIENKDWFQWLFSPNGNIKSNKINIEGLPQLISCIHSLLYDDESLTSHNRTCMMMMAMEDHRDTRSPQKH